MYKRLEPYFPNIEKGIIILLFFFTIINYLVSNVGNLFFYTVIGMEVALILLYLLQLEVKSYGFFWLAFLMSHVIIFFPPGNQYLEFFLSIGGYVAFGILVLIQTFTYSYKMKSFELLNFIVGLLLVLLAALPFLSSTEEMDMGKDQLTMVYGFAISYSIGTIVYNDNLWHRYSKDGKNIMKYILIVFLISVLQLSLKYVNV